MELADKPLTRRRAGRIAGAVLLVVLLAVVVLALFAGWIVTTESGLRFAARMADRLTDGQVVVDEASGRLAGPLRIGALRVDTPDLRLRLQDVSLDWNPAALLDRHLDIATLSIADVAIATRPTEAAPPSGPPQTLRLPVSLSLAALEVGHLAVVQWTAEPAPEPVQPVAPSEIRESEPLAQAPPSTGTSQSSQPPQRSEPSESSLASEPQPAAGADAPQPAVPGPAKPVERDAPAVPPQPVAPAVTFELAALTATVHSDGSRHRIDALQATLPFGQAGLSGEIDGGARPFPLSAAGSLRGELTGHTYALNFRADGDLVAPHIAVNAEGAGLTGSADVLAAPFDPVPLRRLQGALGEIDPSAFNAAAPRAALRVEADLAPAEDDVIALVGPITIENREPDTVDHGGLPVERVAAQLRWTRTATSVGALLIELPGAGTVSGNAAWTAGGDLGRLVANLKLADIDPARLDARLPTAVVAGTLEATGDEAVQTAKLDIRIGDARARATGEMTSTGGSDGARSIVASGEFERFDPHSLVAAAPAASLNMNFDARADLADPLRYDVAWDLRPSRLDGRPVSGRGRVAVEGRRLVDGDVDLVVAGNTVHVRGAWGRAEDSLDFRVDAPALAALGDAFGGSARAEGTISGSVERPAGTLTLFAESLRLPGGLRVARVNAEGRLADGFDGDVRLALGLTGLGRGEEKNLVDDATLGITGRGSAHTIDLVATGLKKDTVRLRLEGGLVEVARLGTGNGVRSGEQRGPRARDAKAGQGGSASGARRSRAGPTVDDAPPDTPGSLASLAWEGRLMSLETSGRFPARLIAPAGLRAGAERVALDSATIEAGERGRIRLDATEWTPESIVARGSLTGLALGLTRRADGSPRRGAGPLVLGAEWDLRLGETAEGTARVFREAGDLRVEGEIPARLGLEHLEARLSAHENRLALSWDARGTELGELVGSATALAERDAIEGWRLAPDAALLGSARLTMPSIAWFGRLMQENIATGGSLAADFALAGTAAEPRASGRIEGRELSIALVDQGLHLSGGELRAEFDRDALRLVRLEFVSPNRVRPRDNRVPVDRLTQEPGRLSASGDIALQTGAGEFRYVADRLPILQRIDRWLILTGGGTARSTWTSLDLDAEFAADAGYVELAETPPPSLSADVVVLGSEAPQEKGGFKLSADVAVALGDHLYLSALGVDTRLTGELQLRVRDDEPMSAVGTISTVGGTFRGYGQNLAIERGRINFQGPLGNPGLNIVALRKGLAVEAGLAIVGSARRPQVRLVSEPNVPDPEKLSWLVLGRAPTAGSGADLGVLLPAAQALLGGPGGGMTDQMSRSLGFDQLSIGQGELTGVSRSPTSRVVGDGTVVTGQGTVSGQVLSLGKRLSSDLFLSFEQSLGGAENLVKLTYQLTRRVSVVARGGSDNSADIYYTISFK